MEEKNSRRDELIVLRNIQKSYESREGSIPAIEDVTFEVEEGDFVVIVGPSGCGKSTLLKIIAGLLDYDEGSIKLRGEEISGPVRDIGMIFQEPALLRWKTVINNVLAPIELMGMNKKEYRQKAEELLQLTNLAGFKNKYPSELSGGMQQRVSICRSLVYDPSLILMDEPFGALDAMTREKMNLELLDIWRESKKTILFVTHSIPEAAFLADRVVALTDRPARINEEITVNLDRPRTLMTKTEDEYDEYTEALYQLMRSEFETEVAG